ncbi:TPA: hypothetical protein HA265_01980 [Candidatus Woesearchaeota archaeon]|nr:hypothetical protein [Candidatus Woesearchaeota archaeon]
MFDSVKRLTYGRTIHAYFEAYDGVSSIRLHGIPLLTDESVILRFTEPDVINRTSAKNILSNLAVLEEAPEVRLQVESERSSEGLIKGLSEVFADLRIVFDYTGNTSRFVALSRRISESESRDRSCREILAPVLEMYGSFQEVVIHQYDDQRDSLDDRFDALGPGESRAVRIQGALQQTSLPPPSDDISIKYSPSFESPKVDSETMLGGNSRNVMRTFIRHKGDLASIEHIYELADKIYL